MAEEKEQFRVASVGTREHPDRQAKLPLWNFLLSSYRGGLGMEGRTGVLHGTGRDAKANGYFPGMFKWGKESEDDYAVRVAITPYRPYGKRIINAFVNYVTSKEPTREGVDCISEDIRDNIDMRGNSMKDFVKYILKMQKVVGEMTILVDNPQTSTPYVSLQAQNESGARPYAIPIFPQDIVDWSLKDNGQYNWLLVEKVTLKNSATEDDTEEITRRYYWDDQRWQIYQEGQRAEWDLATDEDGNVLEGKHDIGMVPAVRIAADNFDLDAYTFESWSYDLFDINRWIYNLDGQDAENFANQTFGQAIVPRDAVRDKEGLQETAGSANAWTESADESGISRYIQPTGMEHETVEKKIVRLSSEMFKLSGLYHRTETGNVESAEAKAWDNEEMSQFLSSFADIAERIEESIYALIGKWTNKECNVKVQYERVYSIDDIQAFMTGILDLKVAGVSSETARKELVKSAIKMMLDGRVPPEVMEQIIKEVDESTDIDPLMELSDNNADE